MPHNDDPNFERRLILAFAMVVLLFLVVLPYFQKTPPAATSETGKSAAVQAPAAKTPTTATAAPIATDTGTKVPAPKPQTRTQQPGSSAPAANTKATAPKVAATEERTVTVDTPVYHIVFSNKGAVAHTWILTEYKDDAGKPLDVVDPTFGKQFGYPLAFWTSDASLRQQLDSALFEMTKTTAADGAQTVAFTWSNGSVVAKKQVHFERGEAGHGYVADISSSVTVDGKPVPVALAWQGAFGDRAVPGDFTTEQFFQQSGSSVETTAVKKINSGATLQGVYQFAGVEDQYFAVAFLPKAQEGTAPTVAITTLKNTYQPRLVDASGNVITNKPVETIGLAVAGGEVNNARLFIGPKKIDLLKAVDPALRGLVDFGWFTFIAEPLFLWMNWTYVHWIPNYGWAILFLTFVITMATFPLKMKQQKSMAKMQALQPQINSLNAKMKKYPARDPRRQEVQQQVMKVYSEHGVNPLGGCLPMLIQLPLIYAFWRVLEYAIELRHAPWIGYIHDLSAKDPYYLLPLGVVVTQFAMSALMPTMAGQDPRQAKLMKWMMPVVVGWFFFYLPSGVNLYYLGYNVISTGQQWVANKTYNDKAYAEVAAKTKETAAVGAGKKRVIEGKVLGKR